MRAKVVGALQPRSALSCTSQALSITYQANHLDTTGIKLVLQLGKGTKFGCAYRCVVGRVTEQDCPAVTNPLVERLDIALHLSVHATSCTYS